MAYIEEQLRLIRLGDNKFMVNIIMMKKLNKKIIMEFWDNKRSVCFYSQLNEEKYINHYGVIATYYLIIYGYRSWRIL